MFTRLKFSSWVRKSPLTEGEVVRVLPIIPLSLRWDNLRDLGKLLYYLQN